MMQQREMSNSEVSEQISRADAFRESLRVAIDEAVGDLDPHSPCIDQARAGLKRISATLDAVPLVTFSNLANINAAMAGRLMPIIAVHLMAVGGGDTLDYFGGACEFLAEFTPMIEMVKRRRAN